MTNKDLQQVVTPTVPSVFDNIEKIELFAQRLSTMKTAIPKFLRNNPGDCFAIATQAFQWRISPLLLAQDAYQVVEGAMLAFGGKVHNAVIIQNAPIIGRPKYEFFGPWEKILGKIVKKRSDKGKEYSAPGWKDADETGLGVKVVVHIVGEKEPRELEVLLSSCYPRNSTLWANDPQQQLTYAAIRKVARRYFPDVLGGAVFVDEFPAPEEIDITDRATAKTVDELLDGEKEPEKTKEDNDELERIFEERVSNYLESIKAAKNMQQMQTIGNQLAQASPRIQDKVRPAYIAKIRELKPKPKDETKVNQDTGEIHFTLADILKKIDTAETSDALDEACDLLRSIPEKDHKAAVAAAQKKRGILEPDQKN